MKLKLDENGNAVLQEGVPVWVDDNGTELAYDVSKLLSKLSAVNAESAGRRKELDDLNAKFKQFEGIDPEKARSALETVANYDAGKLIDAGKVEEVKRQLGEVYKRDLDATKEALAKAEKDYSEKLNAKDTAIRNLLVKGVFESSQFLKNDTVLPPEIAYSYFGKYFEVKEEDGQFKIVPAEDDTLALTLVEGSTPEDVLKKIVDKCPFKDRILRDTLPGGSGATKPTVTRFTKNPWAKESYNVGEQMKLYHTNPVRAKELMQEAGVPIPAGL